MPLSLKRRCTTASFIAATAASCSRSTTGAGVFFGRNNALQLDASKSVNPCSCADARSGKLGDRARLRIVAIGLIAPLSICGSAAQRIDAEIIDALGDQVLHRQRAATIGDMGDIDADSRVDQGAAEMGRGASACRRKLHRGLVCLRVRNEFLQGVLAGKSLRATSTSDTLMRSEPPGRNSDVAL